MASSSAVISASYDEPAGHQPEASCHELLWYVVKAYDAWEDLDQYAPSEKKSDR